MSTNGTALAIRPQSKQNAMDLYAPDAVTATMNMAKALVESGLTPRAIRTPEQAFYVIMKGRELGVPPIRALERINIIDGRCCMAAELMLERFRQRGGRSKWPSNTDKLATIWLKAPNGDEHEESFSWEDATKAGVSGKDNWRKWPKAMLRARAISAGLRAMGEAEGLYDADELGAVTNEDGEVIDAPKALAATTYTPPSPVPSAMPSASSPVQSTAPTYVEHPIAMDSVAEDVELVDEPASDEMVWEYARENTRAPWEPIRQAEKASNAQLAAIHILKAKCKFTQALWKSRLMANFGVDTSALLSKRCASELIDKLEDKAAHQQAALERAHVEMEQGLAHVIAEEGVK